jgi:hypothetical protein
MHKILAVFAGLALNRALATRDAIDQAHGRDWMKSAQASFLFVGSRGYTNLVSFETINTNSKQRGAPPISALGMDTLSISPDNQVMPIGAIKSQHI